MTFKVEVIVDGGMARGKLLQGLNIPESGLAPFPSSESLVRVGCSVIEPSPGAESLALPCGFCAWKQRI